MKNSITTIITACLIITGLNAQDVNQQLGEAQSAYKSGDLQGARFTLQQALNEIDLVIGAEILKILPTKMGEMEFVEADDNVTATSLGYVGLFVSRKYQSDNETNATVEVLSDSPLMAGINTILSIPMFGSDPNQKRIRVGGYRALLQRNQDDSGIVYWDVQIPFGSNLLSFHCKGIDSEQAVTDMVNTIPIDQIAKFAR